MYEFVRPLLDDEVKQLARLAAITDPAEFDALRNAFSLENADVTYQMGDALLPDGRQLSIEGPTLDAEEQAKAMLEHIYGCQFEKVREAPPRKTVDYRSVEGPWPTRVAEVKRLTRPEFLEITHNYTKLRRTRLDSSMLAGRWVVPIWRPYFTTAPERTPGSEGEGLGYKITWASEEALEAMNDLSELGTTPSGQTLLPTPRLKGLLQRLEPLLAVLEHYGIDRISTGTLNDPAWPKDLQDAINGVKVQTHGSASRLSLTHGRGRPGIDLSLGMYGTAAEHADTFARQVQRWLDSDHADKLKQQLRSDLGEVERHAVLVFDPEVNPGARIADEQGKNFCPTESLDLPVEVDIVWFILGRVACWYSTFDGWNSATLPRTATHTGTPAP